jgi:hypothetical protein
MDCLPQDSLRSTQNQLSEAREAFEVTAADNHVMAAKLAEVCGGLGKAPTSAVWCGYLICQACYMMVRQQSCKCRREIVRQRCSRRSAS